MVFSLPNLFHFLWSLKVIRDSNFSINPCPSGMDILKRRSFSFGNWPTLASTHRTSCKNDLHGFSSLQIVVSCTWLPGNTMHTYFFYSIGPDFFNISSSMNLDDIQPFINTLETSFQWPSFQKGEKHSLAELHFPMVYLAWMKLTHLNK